MIMSVITQSTSLATHTEKLQGELIKKIFIHTEQITELHGVLTSPRGDFFRRRLLQYLSGGLSYEEIDKLRQEFGLEETERHLHRLVKYKLIEEATVEGAQGYRRTGAGEEAVNLVRELERKIGKERAQKMFEAALGKNSIRLFLKVYGTSKEPDAGGDLVYTPLEIGQIAAFLPRSIEGLAAIDKLDEAGLVSYLEDGRIHVNPRRSVAFYQYLQGLYKLIFGGA